MATNTSHQTDQLNDHDLEAMIAPTVGRGHDQARLSEYGTPVWALISYLQTNGWDLDQTAADYHLPRVAVEAAVQYYERNKPFIDAFLLLNSDANDF